MSKQNSYISQTINQSFKGEFEYWFWMDWNFVLVLCDTKSRFTSIFCNLCNGFFIWKKSSEFNNNSNVFFFILSLFCHICREDRTKIIWITKEKPGVKVLPYLLLFMQKGWQAKWINLKPRKFHATLFTSNEPLEKFKKYYNVLLM